MTEAIVAALVGLVFKVGEGLIFAWCIWIVFHHFGNPLIG